MAHGVADNNFPHLNTTATFAALVKAGRTFDLFIYPDKNHGIGGGTAHIRFRDDDQMFTS